MNPAPYSAVSNTSRSDRLAPLPTGPGIRDVSGRSAVSIYENEDEFQPLPTNNAGYESRTSIASHQANYENIGFGLVASVKREWPFNSSSEFDPIAIRSDHALSLLNTISYGPKSSMKVIKVQRGETRVFDRVDPTTVSIQGLGVPPAPEAVSRESPNMTIVLVESDVSRRLPMALTRTGLLVLLTQLAIPAEYVEVLVNNNGSCSKSVSWSTEGDVAKEFQLLIKCPTSRFLNSSIYFRVNLETKSTVVTVFGTHLVDLAARFAEIFAVNPSSQNDDTLLHPICILSAIVSEYSVLMEHERRRLDFAVRDQESRTGTGAHQYDEALKAQTSEYAELNKSLHVVEAYVMFLYRTCEFQVRVVEFLRGAHADLKYHMASRAERPKWRVIQAVDHSLDRSHSMSVQRLEQVKTLGRRVQIQLSVVENFVSQNDSRINLLLAKQSAQIAMDTRYDSVAMKTIAGITMLFLPGTFVATFFSMVFFQIEIAGGRPQLTVNPYWWLYLAGTVPLTLLTVVVWFAWLRWKLNPEKLVQREEGYELNVVRPRSRSVVPYVTNSDIGMP